MTYRLPMMITAALLLAAPAFANDGEETPALPPLVEQEIDGDREIPDIPPAPQVSPATSGGIIWQDESQNPAPVTTPAVTENQVLTQEERTEWLNRVSAYFNSFETLKARFTQLAWDGSSTDGTLKIKRPGKFRFDYDPPVPLYMASDGIWFVMVDRELDSINRLPMINTPLAPVTAKTVDLANNRDITVAEMVLQENALRITLARPEADEDGSITLYFRTTGDLELTQWKVIDASGLPTTVVLGEIEKGLFLSNHDFLVLDNNE